jgi:hypothetical protein
MALARPRGRALFHRIPEYVALAKRERRTRGARGDSVTHRHQHRTGSLERGGWGARVRGGQRWCECAIGQGGRRVLWSDGIHRSLLDGRELGVRHRMCAPPIGNCGRSAVSSIDAESNGCGGAFLPADRECESDAQCLASERCVEAALDPCRSGRGTSCEPACTSDSCADGERCVEGRCEAVPCDQGYSCSELQVRAPERAGSDAHGCAPRNCDEGAACGAGYAWDAKGSGRCLAVHCREGGSAACAINQICSESAAGRGCLPKPCAVDGDCDCGASIHRCTGAGCPSGECAPRLGLCITAAAGPL